MPYKDIEKRRECRKRWYANNKESEKNHVKKRKFKIKKWFESYKKNLQCTHCSENHPATLEFHHSMKNKEKSISDMIHNGYSIDSIKKEISKCVLLCSNCHKKEHYKNK
jgi:transcription elongation factor Elf1